MTTSNRKETMKQSKAPLVVVVERGVFVRLDTPTGPLVAGKDFVTLDLAEQFECTKCGLYWPMAQAVIDVNERPLCPLCAGRWTHPQEVKP